MSGMKMEVYNKIYVQQFFKGDLGRKEEIVCL